MTPDDLLREASDPATTAERLDALWTWAEGPDLPTNEQVDEVIATILRNPSLDPEKLRQWLLASGRHTVFRGAWHNPSVPLLLLTGPDQALVAAAIETFIWPSYYLAHVHEPAEETLRTLGVHVRRRLADDFWHDEAKALARRFVDLFSLAPE